MIRLPVVRTQSCVQPDSISIHTPHTQRPKHPRCPRHTILWFRAPINYCGDCVPSGRNAIATNVKGVLKPLLRIVFSITGNVAIRADFRKASKPVADPNRPGRNGYSILRVSNPNAHFDIVETSSDAWTNISDNHERPPQKYLRIFYRIWPPVVVLAVPIRLIRNSDGIDIRMIGTIKPEVSRNRPLCPGQQRFFTGLVNDFSTNPIDFFGKGLPSHQSR